MSRRSYRLVALVAGVVMLSGSLAWSLAGENKKRENEQEKHLTFKQLPAPVQATINKEAGKNKIKEIEQVTRGDKKFYEAGWVAEGKEIEIKVAPDGKLLKKEVEERKGKHKPSGESERKMTEAEVPAAALATLKKMAAGAKITEFAEEVEHGSKFYEGSWKGPDGNVDVLVTAAGALVEIEKKVGTKGVPQAVLAAAQKAAGKDAKLGLEKKTKILYEVHFKKGDRRVELLLTPDGRCVGKEDKKHHEEKEREEEEREEGEHDED